jgi:hypothetical protein
MDGTYKCPLDFPVVDCVPLVDRIDILHKQASDQASTHRKMQTPLVLAETCSSLCARRLLKVFRRAALQIATRARQQQRIIRLHVNNARTLRPIPQPCEKSDKEFELVRSSQVNTLGGQAHIRVRYILDHSARFRLQVQRIRVRTGVNLQSSST